MMGDDPELPAGDDELRAFLRAIAPQPPLNPHLDNGPWDFLLRLPDAELHARVLPIARELLADPDPCVRDRALSLCMNVSHDHDQAATTARLLEIAATGLFAEAAPRRRLAQALANVRAGSGREAEIDAAIARLATAPGS